MAVGQTMPNLNVPIVSRFQIIKPPLEVQKAYYDFIEQTDKSKLTIQQSLDKLELLKKSLMQEYFG
jgi:type I restriction enzyme S subunit